MRRVQDERALRGGAERFPAIVRLAFWRVRQNRGLLTLIGVGMVTAIVLVCAIPLYAEAAMSAGLRQLFYANPPFSYISITAQSGYGSTSGDILQEEDTLNHDFQRHLQDAVSLPPQLLAQTSFPLLAIQGHSFPQPQYYDYALALSSFDMSQVMPHIRIVQGRFPANNANEIEIMLLPDLAKRLGAKVGDVLTAPLNFSLFSPPDPHLPPLPQTLRFRLVGIFTVIDENDVFWHGLSLQMSYAVGAQRDTIIAPAIVSNPAFFAVYDDLQRQAAQHNASWNASLSLTWYYLLLPRHLSAGHIDQLLSGLSFIERDVSNSVDQQLSSSVQNVQILDPSGPIDQYRSRIVAVRIPVAIISLFVLGLILYFVHLMAALLVSRQTETITLMRSRGGSLWQIFAIFATQGVGLGIIGFLVAPLLAPFLVSGLISLLLPPAAQDVQNLVPWNLLQTIAAVFWYDLAVALVTVGALCLGVYQTARLNILGVRREQARSSRHGFWQHLPPDVVTLVIACTLYAVALYLLNTGLIDPQLRTLLLSPLTLVALACMVLAGAFLFLRLFPRLLRGGEWLAMRHRGAAPMLALSQVARSPLRAINVLLLLALAMTFTIFALVFTASQQQRPPDVADYQVGADFSGSIVHIDVTGRKTLTQMSEPYLHIPGVLSASLGCTLSEVFVSNGVSVNVGVMAVDAGSYAQSATWTEPDAAVLPSLMKHLQMARPTVLKNNVIPAIVDAATWDALRLTPGAHFVLDDANGLLPYVAIARVAYIPGSANTGTIGNILVDYQSLADLYRQDFNIFPPAISSAWLHTRSDAASLASVRRALSQGDLQLNPLFDRRAIIAQLQYDPLELSLLGVLLPGAIVPLVLALVGNIVASWVSASTRLVSFGVLRALGSAPRQIAQILAWEQGITYTAALLTGIVLGFLMAWLAIPVLVYTTLSAGGFGSTTGGSMFFALQDIPPVQFIVPVSLYAALAVFIVICALALGLMIRLALVTMPGLILRLNED
jgi:ABC-type lipoprotein release transport system permease subunit